MGREDTNGGTAALSEGEEIDEGCIMTDVGGRVIIFCCETMSREEIKREL